MTKFSGLVNVLNFTEDTEKLTVKPTKNEPFLKPTLLKIEIKLRQLFKADST